MAPHPDRLIFRGGPNFRLGSGCSKEEHDALCSALWSFVKSGGLLSPAGLRLTPESNWDAFEIRHSHFTEEGRSVMKAGFSDWLRALDRGTPPDKASSLARALKRARTAGPGEVH